MNILQIDREIEKALDGVVDPETGEITFNAEELEQLAIERERKIDGLFQYIINQQAFIRACEEEEAAIAKRREHAENHVKRLKEYALLVMGEEKKRVTPVYQANVRKSEKTVADTDFIKWAKRHAKHLLRTKTAEQVKAYKEPVADLTAIKAAIKAGEAVKHASIETSYSITIK